MEKILLGVFLLGGCATAGAKDSQVPPSRPYCLIAEPERWQSAEKDFSRTRTLEAISSFEEAAKIDREKLHAGATGEVGQKLDNLYTTYTPPAFISSDVMGLGVRLRQLDCAVRGDRLSFAIADKLYEKILNDLAVERAIFDPTVGKPRAGTP